MCSRIASVPGGSVSSPAAAQRGASRNAHTASPSKINVRFMIERRAPVDLRPPIHECKPSPHYAAKQFGLSSSGICGTGTLACALLRPFVILAAHVHSPGNCPIGRFTAVPRTRPRPQRSRRPQHDRDRWHRPVCRQFSRHQSHGRPTSPHCLARRRSPRHPRRLRLVRTRRRHAQSGRHLRFPPRSLGPGRWGRLMSFLFVWQTFVQAPLSVASASIGFARYAGYLHPLALWQAKAISGSLVIFLVILLYRKITTIGKISVLLWVGVVGTMLWLIWGGIRHFDPKLAFDFPPGAFHLSSLWFAGLGAAMINTVYSYWGYYNICHLGGEIREPEKNIPRGIFLSILGITVLYLAMQTSLLGVVPWREA